MYCSERCKAAHAARGHGLLCVGSVAAESAESDPLVQFKVHAVSSNEALLLAGDVCAAAAMVGVVGEVPPASGAFPQPTTLDACEAALAAEDAAAGAAARGAPGAADDRGAWDATPFADFVQEPWWEVAVDEATGKAAAGAGEVDGLGGALFGLCDVSARMLRAAWAPRGPALGPRRGGGGVGDGDAQADGPALDGWLTARRVGRVVGMFEQNNVGVHLPATVQYAAGVRKAALDQDDDPAAAGDEPTLAQLLCALLDEYVEAESEDEAEGSGDEAEGGGCGDDCGDDCASHGSHDDGPAMPSVEEAHARVAAADIDDLREALPALSGTALLSTICAANHSCRPNATVVWGAEEVGGALVAKLLATRHIAAGEELTFSYIDTEAPLAARRRMLRDYGFECACEKCAEEAATLEADVRTVPGGLSREACARLVAHVEARVAAEGNAPDSTDGAAEVQVDLPKPAWASLRDIVGADAAVGLWRTLAALPRAAADARVVAAAEPPWDESVDAGMFVRRYSPEDRPGMPFHADQSDYTINVALNDRAEYRGGDLACLLVADGVEESKAADSDSDDEGVVSEGDEGVDPGQRTVVIDRPDAGDTTVHGPNVVHAVRPTVEGRRYTLLCFLWGTRAEERSAM